MTIYYYLIDRQTNLVIACFGHPPENYNLPSNYIIRSGDYGIDVDQLYYDPETDEIKKYTAEQYLDHIKQIKLMELKTEIQAQFADINDMLADIVKAIKLIIQYVLATDENEKNSVGDFLKVSFKELDMLYPDDYARHCVAEYIKALVEKLPLYYKAKALVEKATTTEEVEAITLESIS